MDSGFNQDVAKKCGSKWELGKMDRTLIRMWQKSVGLNGNLAKMDRALIRMWQKSVGLNWNLAKWIGF